MRKQVSNIRHPSAEIQIPNTACIVKLWLYLQLGIPSLYPCIYYRSTNPPRR